MLAKQFARLHDNEENLLAPLREKSFFDLVLKMVLFVLSVLLWVLPSQTPNCGCEADPQVSVLAVVNGIKITKQDLSIDARTQVSIAQEEVITARRQEVTRQVNKLLLETAAKRRGITSAQLVDLEINAKLTPPTDDEVRAFYESSQRRFGKDFKAVKKQVIASLNSEREMIRRDQFAAALRAGAQLTVSDGFVTPPSSEADLDRIFATVNGINITSRDVEQSLLPLIFRVQQQVYEFRKQDLDLKINDLLLEQEAKRLGVTPQSLINQNVKLLIPIVTEKQARDFHSKSKIPEDFSKVKFQIMDYLLKLEERKLVLAYAEQLRKAAAVQIYLMKPASPTLRQLCCNPVD